MSQLATTTASLLAFDEEHERKLFVCTFILFFNSDPVEKIFSAVCSILGISCSTLIASAIIYFPALLALASRAKRGEKLRGLSFVFLYCVLALLFALSACLHPEYVDLMHNESWRYNVWDSVFNPMCGIFGFFIIMMCRERDTILTGFTYAAYLNYAYCMARLLLAMHRGYWKMYSSAGLEIEGSYNLGFGYDMLFSVAVLMLLVFLGKNRKLNGTLAFFGTVFILMEGGRWALFCAGACAFLLFAYLGFCSKEKTRAQVVLYIAFFVSLILIALLYEDLLRGASGLLSQFGISSRTIDAFLAGTIDADNGRDAIYSMALDLIQNGGLLGWGFYGDRYYISPRFYWGYPHNMVYELQITFGLVLGTALFVALVAFALYAFFKGRDAVFKPLAIILFACSLQLVLSNSYLYSKEFWALVAVLVLLLQGGSASKFDSTESEKHSCNC